MKTGFFCDLNFSVNSRQISVSRLFPLSTFTWWWSSDMVNYIQIIRYKTTYY